MDSIERRAARRKTISAQEFLSLLAPPAGQTTQTAAATVAPDLGAVIEERFREVYDALTDMASDIAALREAIQLRDLQATYADEAEIERLESIQAAQLAVVNSIGETTAALQAERVVLEQQAARVAAEVAASEAATEAAKHGAEARAETKAKKPKPAAASDPKPWTTSMKKKKLSSSSGSTKPRRTP